MAPPPTLSIRHPLPDLTEFVVSPARPSLLGGPLGRLAVLAALIAWLGTKLDLDALKSGRMGELWENRSSSPVLALLGFLFLLAYTLTQKTLVCESITPLPSLGLLLSTTHTRTFLPFLPLSTQQTVVPMDDILDICINEGIRLWAVVGFLCVLRKGKDETVVVFPETLPRTAMLMEVYHGVREILWDEFDDDDDEADAPVHRQENTMCGTGNGVRGEGASS